MRAEKLFDCLLERLVSVSQPLLRVFEFLLERFAVLQTCVCVEREQLVSLIRYLKLTLEVLVVDLPLTVKLILPVLDLLKSELWSLLAVDMVLKELDLLL